MWPKWCVFAQQTWVVLMNHTTPKPETEKANARGCAESPWARSCRQIYRFVLVGAWSSYHQLTIKCRANKVCQLKQSQCARSRQLIGKTAASSQPILSSAVCSCHFHAKNWNYPFWVFNHWLRPICSWICLVLVLVFNDIPPHCGGSQIRVISSAAFAGLCTIAAKKAARRHWRVSHPPEVLGQDLAPHVVAVGVQKKQAVG